MPVEPQPRALRIAVVGDVHLRWDDEDVRGLDEAGYDLVLFVGDLAGYLDDGFGVAASIARMRIPALVVAGNHDAVRLSLLVAEVARTNGVLPGPFGHAARWLARSHVERYASLERTLSPVPLGGYSVHPGPALCGDAARDLAIVAARPCSLGGPHLAFPRLLEERFGVRTMADSAAPLCALIDATEARDLLFVAHNGPRGLGDRRHDIFGCDFKKQEGDFGDSDLAAAVAHARARGKRVRAVVAGHMHHTLRGGGQRMWQVQREGVLYVNAARVPRVFRRGGRVHRHHVALTLDARGARAEPCWVHHPATEPPRRSHLGESSSRKPPAS